VTTLTRLIPVLCAGVIAQAVAAGSDQPAPQPAAEAAKNTETPALIQSQDAKDAASPVAAKTSKVVILIDNDVTDDQLKQIMARGYKPESHDGRTVYCRREQPTGTRFPTKTCRTSAQIFEDEQQGKDAASRIEKTGGSRQIGH
jgi:hypothetical protein